MQHASIARHLVSREQLQRQLERELIPTGIEVSNGAFEGLPRGAVTELYGAASSGKTSFVHKLLATATRAGEYCAYVDATGSFDPVSASLSGTHMEHLLWVRCQAANQVLKAADLLIHSGGWGVVVADFASVATSVMRRVPLSYWYRFRRAVENTPTVFVVLEQEPYVKNCAEMALEIGTAETLWPGGHSDFRVLRGAQIRIHPRKPVRPEKPVFLAKAVG